MLVMILHCAYPSSMLTLAFDLSINRKKKPKSGRAHDLPWHRGGKGWKSPAVFTYPQSPPVPFPSPPFPSPPHFHLTFFFFALSFSSVGRSLALSPGWGEPVSHHSHGKSCQSKFGERKWRPCSLPKPPNLFLFLLCVCVCAHMC